MDIRISLSLLLLLCSTIDAFGYDEYHSNYHYEFFKSNSRSLYFSGIAKKPVGFKLYFSMASVSSSDPKLVYGIETDNHATYTTSNLSTHFQDGLPVFIINDDQLKTGVTEIKNKGLVAIKDNYDIVNSEDNGKTWNPICTNCVKIDFTGEKSSLSFFKSRTSFGMSWSTQIGCWIAPVMRNMETFIMGGKTIKNFKFGNNWSMNKSYEVFGFFEIADSADSNKIKAYILYRQPGKTETHAQCMLLTMGSDEAPALKIIGKPIVLDYGFDISKLHVVDDGFSVKSEKTLFSVFHNPYERYDNRVFVLPTPRKLTLKGDDLCQKFLVDTGNSKIWKQSVTLPSFTFKSDKDPFACQRSVSFAFTAELTGSHFELWVRGDSNLEHYTKVGYNETESCFIETFKTPYLKEENATQGYRPDIYHYDNRHLITGGFSKKQVTVEFQVLVDTFMAENFCQVKDTVEQKVNTALILSDPKFDRLKMVGKDGSKVKDVKFFTYLT